MESRLVEVVLGAVLGGNILHQGKLLFITPES